MATTEPATLRADARRNLVRIIDAATQAFAEQGLDVPMDEIARLAGVGVGTLYRRFPDREALVVAVVRASLAAILKRNQRLASGPGSAWDRLVDSMRPSAELRLTLRLSSAFTPSTSKALRADPEYGRIRAEMERMAAELVGAAQAEGSMRNDVEPADVMFLFSLLLSDRSHGEHSFDPDDPRYQRVRAVALDGLRAAAKPAT
jgi:AcrR family transcriptional regulator